MRKFIFAVLVLCVTSVFAAGTLTPLNLYRDGNSANTMVRSAPFYIDAMVLAANVAETYTKPTGAKTCVFSANAPFYARPNATAAVPSTEVADGTGSELSPASWNVGDVTTISFIAPTAAIITLSCYN